MLLSFFCSTPFSILFTCCLPTGRHLSVGRLSSHLCAGNALALSLRRRFTVSLVELGLCYHSIASLYSHSFHTAINVHFALWLYCIFHLYDGHVCVSCRAECFVVWLRAFFFLPPCAIPGVGASTTTAKRAPLRGTSCKSPAATCTAAALR
jgi:hypothetical protein